MPAFSAAFASLVATGIGTATALGGSILTSGIMASNIAMASLGFLSKAALGIALNALTPKPKVQSRGYQVNTRGSALDQQVIYGQTRVGGVVAYENVLDEVFLYTALVHAGHPIASYEEVYIGDTIVLDWIRYSDGATVTSADFAYNNHERYTPKTTANLDIFGDPVDSKVGIYFNKNTDSTVQNDNYNIYISFYDGNQTTANDFLVASFGEWTSDHKLQGCAYMVVNQAHASEQHNSEAFPNGPKEITATIKGREVYDPRTTTTGWSDNPALCLRDYLTSDFGLGEATANIDDTVITSAANACDVVANDGNKFFTCNGTFTTQTQPADVLGDMLTSMGGLLWYSQGKWRMKPAYWIAPTLTLDEDDLRSPIAVKTRISRRDNFNKVRGTFRGEETAWQVAEFPEVRNITPTTTEVAATALVAGEWYQIKTTGTSDFTTVGAGENTAGWSFQATGAATGTGVVYTTVDANLVADGGQESAIDLEMPFTTNYAEARRIARITLERSRQQLTVSASFGLSAFKLQVGDNVRLTNSRFGWTNKEFEVVSWTFGLVDGYDLQVQMTLRETAEAIFDEVDDSVVYERDNSNNPYTPVGPVTSLASALDGTVATDGSFVNSIRVTWDAPAVGRSTGYLVEWQEDGATVWNSALVNGTAYNLVPIKDETVYNIRVAAYGAFNNLSTYATSSLDSSKDGTTPNAATSLVASPLDAGAVINWTAPTTNTDASALNDLFYYDVYRGTTTAPTTFIGRVSGTSYTDTGLTNDTLYYYRVKAVDFSGNESAYSSQVTVTPTLITGGEDGTDGEDAIRVVLTNPVAIIKNSNAGTTAAADDFTDTGTSFTLREGDTVLNYDTTPVAGEWLIAATSNSGVTMGAISPANGTVSDHTAMTGDSRTITYHIVGVRADNTLFTTKAYQVLRRVYDGVRPITVISNKSAYAIPVDSSGTVNYVGSAPTVRVFEGETELTYDNTPIAGEWEFTAKTVESGTISSGAYNVSTGVITDHSGMTTDTAVIRYDITGRRENNEAFTASFRQTITKVADGATGPTGATGATGDTGPTGATGDEGRRSYSGRVYYTALQSTTPGAISETSVTFNESTGKFTGGTFSATPGWRHEQPSVDITDTTVQEWSATYNVSVDGTVTFPDTAVANTEFSFGTPSGAIQVTTDIQSDNFVTGTSGWNIERDTGNAEFNDITARGTVQSSNWDGVLTGGAITTPGTVGWIILDNGASEFNDIDIRNTIQSTNYDNVGPTYAGWQINSDGSAVFNDATIRGTLDASDITVSGTFSASAINLNGAMLEDSGGALQIVTGGVDTTQLASGAVTAQAFNQLSTGGINVTTVTTAGVTGALTGNETTVETSSLSTTADGFVDIWWSVDVKGENGGTGDGALFTITEQVVIPGVGTSYTRRDYTVGNGEVVNISKKYNYADTTGRSAGTTECNLYIDMTARTNSTTIEVVDAQVAITEIKK